MNKNKKNKIIVVGGKGGVGKTTISAIIVKLLVQNNENLLVIDADPVISLTHTLGEKPEMTIGDYREILIGSNEEKKSAIKRPMKTIIREMLIESSKGYHLLPMGRSEAAGCFCGINEMLRFGIAKLCGEYDITLIDCEAGIEQVNRRAVHHIDNLILLTDTSKRGMETLVQLRDIAVKHNEGNPINVNVIVNTIQNKEEEEGIIQYATDLGLEVIGSVPEDVNVRNYNRKGMPLFDLPDNSPAVVSLKEIFSRIDAQ